MKRFLVTNIVIFYFVLTALCAVPISKMRIHCVTDTTEINTILADLTTDRHSSTSSAIIDVAMRFENVPYVAHTLEDSIESLTINVHQFDCMTFVETVIALVQSTSVSNPTWRDFSRYLESIRYRQGVMDGYVSRLHYVADWIADNTYRGNLREITADIAGSSSMAKSLDYMTKNSKSYPAMADSVVYAGIKKVEMGYRNHRIPYIKKELISKKSVWVQLRDGDIMVILSKTNGLDASHIAFIKMIDGVPYLLHASSSEGKVVLTKESIKENFKHTGRTSPGVRILRLCE